MAEAQIITEEIPSSDTSAKTKLVTVSGQLDESNVDEKSKEVYKLFEEVPGKLNLVFDFAGLEYMNSKSIGYLTDWYGKVTEKGGKVLIARAKPNIKDILDVVGLTQLIQMFESLDEAKQAVEQGGDTTPATTPEPTATPAVPAVTPEPEAAATTAPVTPVEAEEKPVEVPVTEAPTEPETTPEVAPGTTPAPEETSTTPETPAPEASTPEATPEAAPTPAVPETPAPATPEATTTPTAEPTPTTPEETYKLNDQK